MAYWGEYVPVALRRAKAQKQLDKLFKKGSKPQPVTVEGKKISSSVWGQAWCKHLESFSDYSNRLPRGRAYVRNGSVCHLEVLPGEIKAFVCGTSLYTISIFIKPLKAGKWKTIKKRCSGHIGSMLELLQGKLSSQVMAVVADRDQGLFPQPGEIGVKCSCPDWATMCKHVASVLYGVGNRLDQEPELLFVLRGVDAQELISTEISLPGGAAVAEESLSSDSLAGIFGVDLDLGEAPQPPAAKKPAKRKAPAPRKKAAAPAKSPAARKKKAAAAPKLKSKAKAKGKTGKS